jgi:hypothetical protein
MARGCNHTNAPRKKLQLGSTVLLNRILTIDLDWVGEQRQDLPQQLIDFAGCRMIVCESQGPYNKFDRVEGFPRVY